MTREDLNGLQGTASLLPNGRWRVIAGTHTLSVKPGNVEFINTASVDARVGGAASGAWGVSEAFAFEELYRSPPQSDSE